MNVTVIRFVWQFKRKFANKVVSRFDGAVGHFFPEATDSNISTNAKLVSSNFLKIFGGEEKSENLALDSAQDVALGRMQLEAWSSMKLIKQERSEPLAGALMNLLDDERSAVVLKHFHNWSVADIAEHLGRTQVAVAGLLRRGLKKLRELLRKED